MRARRGVIRIRSDLSLLFLLYYTPSIYLTERRLLRVTHAVSAGFNPINHCFNPVCLHSSGAYPSSSDLSPARFYHQSGTIHSHFCPPFEVLCHQTVLGADVELHCLNLKALQYLTLNVRDVSCPPPPAALPSDV